MLEEVKSGIKLGIGIAVGMLLVQLATGTLFMLGALVLRTLGRI